MNTNFKTIRAVGFTLVVAMLCSAGCTSPWKTPKMLSLDNTWPFRDKDKPQEGMPVRMVGAWTDTVLTQTGQKPQRGFGGRLLFYEKEGKKPILVDGQLVVYAFDEAGRDQTDNKPTRRYVFPAEQMPLHMSKSELGASYSFWLPWDEAGGPKTEVSLICRFEPKGGAVVTSEQTRHLLPGTAPPATTTAGAKQPPKVPEGVPSKPPRQTLEGLQSRRAADRRAQLISYEAPAAGDQQTAVVNAAPQASAQPEKHMTATTIALPQGYQLPDAATLNAAMPAAAARTYATTMSAAPVQPTGITRPYLGSQQPQQLPPNAPATMYPGTQPMTAAPPSWNNMTAGQMPQQQFQQPLMQQPMLQQPAIRQSQPALQSWPQMPNQAVPATAFNYPAPGQLPR